MKHLKFFEEYQIIDQRSEILNNSFNFTMKDFDELINYLKDEYNKNSDNYDYIISRKNILMNLLKTNYSFDNTGLLIGIENFPNQIKLYRIIDNFLENIDTKCLGRCWCYSKEYLKTDDFQNSVGFDKEKPWYVIEAVYTKDDIDIYETIYMQLVNSGEREITLKDKCIKPIEYKIIKYENFN
jgi:hypothetical protein